MGIFARFFRFLKGLGLLFVGKVEKENPRAILETEMANFDKAQADFNNGLAKQAGLIELKKAAIAKGKKDKEALEGRITSLLAIKDETKAGELAVMLQNVEAKLTEDEEMRATAEDMYKNLTGQRDTFVKASRKRLEEVKGKISAAEMATAQAKLAEMVTDVAFNPDGSGLNALDEQVSETLANAQGKIRVAQDAVSASPWALTEAEQKANAELALAKFRVKAAETADEKTETVTNG